MTFQTISALHVRKAPNAIIIDQDVVMGTRIKIVFSETCHLFASSILGRIRQATYEVIIIATGGFVSFLDGGPKAKLSKPLSRVAIVKRE